MANNKQLRLDVAQLTDVGRKREHNEDNMAYVIPKDPQVMAKKGALFIVADGMGGHAAGEVASEIAVDTVSNVYYQDDSDDVAVSLLHAIKRANALIHQRAAENMLRSGMGTTCVAAVLRGNMAYIANVGDSRAYLVRHSQVKQVSQDHSWVAEQVRAGLLTEDQARTHAQRNVITRCLGTQADVEIDVFPEQLEEKDALVLCTDGLSGLVSDDEIRRIIDQSGPQESVYHLVERANENGGPDNITAIVISVLEVGVEPPSARHPAYVGGREVGEDAATLGMAPGAPGVTTPTMYGDGRTPTNSLRYVSGPLAPEEIVTAPQPALPVSQPRSGRGRLFYSTLALLLLLLVVLAASGGYLFFKGTKTGATLDQSLSTDQRLLTKAKSELAANPIAALHDLAAAQTNLRSLAHNGALTSQQQQKIQRLLQQDVVTETQAAITSYNTLESITALPCPSGSQVSALGGVPAGLQVKSFALVQMKKSVLYILDISGKLFEVDNNNLVAVSLPAALATATIVDIAGDGAQLALLTSSTSTVKNVPTTVYSLSLLTPGQTKQTDASVALTLTNGQVPRVISAAPPDVYVAATLSSAQTSSSTTIMDFTLSKSHLSPSAQNSFSVSAPLESMAAFPSHQLFLLLTDGSVHSLTVMSGSAQVAAPAVLVKKVIAQPLPISASDFTWTMSVPQVTPGGTTSLAVSAETTFPHVLAVGQVGTTSHLFILDAPLHRVLDLQVADSLDGSAAGAGTPTSGATPTSTAAGGGVGTGSSSVTLQLSRQYTSASLFAQAKGITFDPLSSQLNPPQGTQAQGSTPGASPGTHVNVVTQPSASALSFTTFSTDPGSGCAK